MKYLAVKDFATFQHYRDRNPVWIKLYTALLVDPAFIQMQEAAQAQLMKLWILTAQLGHPLPNNPKLLAGKIGTTGKFHLPAILASGFLVECDDLEAASLIANRKENASRSLLALEERGEIEVENRTTSITAASGETEARLAAWLETDTDRTALTAVLLRAPSRDACLMALDGIVNGLGVSRAPTPAQFGAALRDYAGNAANWNAAHFRGYLKRAMAQPVRPPAGATAPSDTGESRGRGALYFGKIRELVDTRQQPGQAAIRFIPRAKVAALGEDVLRAYESVGGADRFLAANGTDIGFLLRDFSNALEAVHV